MHQQLQEGKPETSPGCKHIDPVQRAAGRLYSAALKLASVGAYTFASAAWGAVTAYGRGLGPSTRFVCLHASQGLWLPRL